MDQTLAFGPEVRGKIPVVRGIADTEALVLGAQRAGALAVVQIDATDVLHEDIVSTIWGMPTTETASRLPTIPYLCIAHSDGARLTTAAAADPLTAELFAEVTRGWRVEPNIVAEVPGRSGDFLLVTTHLDAWYRGMTDTAGSVASILEMARVLQQHKGELARGVRFAWWTGHSFGRYAGSGWYVDRFWAELDRHCVGQTHLDGPGRRGSRLDAVSVSGWPGLVDYVRESAERLTGIKPPGPRGQKAFRPGRDSDSAFQGLGIPFFSIGVPGPPDGHPEVDAAGRIAYWHTPEDTIEKLDMKALLLDTEYAPLSSTTWRRCQPSPTAWGRSPARSAPRSTILQRPGAASISQPLAPRWRRSSRPPIAWTPRRGPPIWRQPIDTTLSSSR